MPPASPPPSAFNQACRSPAADSRTQFVARACACVRDQVDYLVCSNGAQTLDVRGGGWSVHSTLSLPPPDVSKIIQALRDAIAPDLATILLMAHVDKSPLAGAIIMSPQTHTASHLRPGAPGSNRITEIQKTQSAVRFLDPELKRPDYVCLMDDILQWQSHPQYKDVDGAGRCSVKAARLWCRLAPFCSDCLSDQQYSMGVHGYRSIHLHPTNRMSSTSMCCVVACCRPRH